MWMISWPGVQRRRRKIPPLPISIIKCNCEHIYTYIHPPCGDGIPCFCNECLWMAWLFGFFGVFANLATCWSCGGSQSWFAGYLSGAGRRRGRHNRCKCAGETALSSFHPEIPFPYGSICTVRVLTTL
jgi:hypothetical protein